MATISTRNAIRAGSRVPIILPQEVDPDGASVTFKNGILTVRLPKVDKKKMKKLKVKTD